MTRLILCLSIFSAVASALAQPMQYGANKRFMMIMYPDVSRELKLSKDQQKQIQTTLNDAQKNPSLAMSMGGFSLFDPSGELPEGMAGALNESQKARLEELFMQANGGLALIDPKVSKALELTSEQTEKVGTIKSEANTKSQELLMKMSDRSTANKLKELKKEFGERLLSLLTTEQRAKWDSLLGKPFKFRN